MYSQTTDINKEQFPDSDLKMLAEESFAKILQKVQSGSNKRSEARLIIRPSSP